MRLKIKTKKYTRRQPKFLYWRVKLKKIITLTKEKKREWVPS